MPKRNPLSWLSSTGSVLAVLAPKGLCPICVAASGGVLSSIGLGFLAVNDVIRWVLPMALALGLVGLFFASRGHRRWSVLGLGVLGSVVLYGGWLATSFLVLYVGMALLLGASVFNFWSRRNPKVALVQLGQERKITHGAA
jgi:hypothetical protein